MSSKVNKNEARAVASGSQRSSLEQAFPKNSTNLAVGAVKVKTIRLDVYDAVIGLILPGAKKPDVKKWYYKTWPQYKKYYKPLEKKLDFKQEYYKGCFLSNGDIYMIHIPAYDNLKSLYSTVSHECLHATNRILKDKHIPQKESTEECYAYVQGYLTSLALDHILNNAK